MRFTTNQAKSTHFLPADQLRDIRYSLSLNEEEGKAVQDFVREIGAKRAEISREAMLVGMWHFAVRNGLKEKQQQLAKILVKHNILPDENVVIVSKLQKTG